MRETVYLDNHATTRVDPRVLEAMLPYFSNEYGNASSTNSDFGERAAKAVERARAEVAALLHTDPQNIVFTSGATEANNLALKGVLQRSRRRRHLVTDAAEHRAVLDAARRLQRRGASVTVLPVTETGAVELDRIRDALTTNSALVSVMAANNEVGTLNRIHEIGELCNERGVLFHSDAVQWLGSQPLDLAHLPVDLLSLSAHKIYGPKGVGALFVRRDGPQRIPLEPLIDGGGQEFGLRSGTLPVPLIVGFGVACRLLQAEREEEQRRIGRLRDRLWTRLREEVDDLTLNGPPISPPSALPQRLNANLNVSIGGVDGEALMQNLQGLAVSSGSACTSSNPDPSHVLRALGRDAATARASLRFGLGRFNTAADIDTAVAIVTTAVRRLRAHTL